MIRERVKKSALYNRAKAFYAKYERWLIPGMLVVGIAADFVTFRAINITTAFILIGVHLVLSGSFILYINAYDSEFFSSDKIGFRYLRLAGPLVLQFSFGALLSASFIFYWFSGILAVSWPFIILLLILMVSNDVLRHYYLRPKVQVGVYYFIVFSTSTVVLPWLFNSIEVWVFLVGGLLSLVLIYLYIKLLSIFLEEVREEQSTLGIVVLCTFIAMNLLYFTNIIPPIPLSLREADVYHQVERTETGYALTAERQSLFERALPGTTISLIEGGQVYVFTSIFAPTDLNTTITHHWEHYNAETKRWVTWSKPTYDITGGRDDGYRGYSFSARAPEGRWRVTVETKRGQALGRLRFRVKRVNDQPETFIIFE